MDSDAAPQNTESELADDMLEGARAITKFVYKRVTRRNLRKIYYLAQNTKLPVFRLGSVLCARKSVLLEFIQIQENRALLREQKNAAQVTGYLASQKQHDERQSKDS